MQSFLRFPALKRRFRAFTLLELLVSVVVIGILASLALIRFGSAQEKAYVATMQSDLRNFATARAIHISEDGDASTFAAVEASGFSLSELVFDAGYKSESATEWALLVGHNKTATRCVLSTFESQGGAHRIACARDLALEFSATSSGSTVTVDAGPAINSLAFAPDEQTGAAFAADISEIALVSWEYGDGAAEGGDPATFITRTHTYAKPGTYTVKLTLVKKTGEVRSGAKSAEVTGVSNAAPVASFTYTPTAPETGSTVTFTSTSSDANGDALTLTWDIAGTAASGASAQATFSAAGTYTVKLTATDGKGGSHTASQEVVVAQANRAPTADFSFSPTAPKTGETITFTATASDADGDALAYSWDFGAWGGVKTGNPTTNSYSTASTYSVELTVSDGKGGVVKVTKSVTVASAVASLGKIAFASNRSGNFDIYVMNGDGTNQTRITTNSASEVWPAWSPDRSKIAFVSNRDGNNEIYVMNADGTNHTRLTVNTDSDERPSWSPDGSKIAFHSDRDGSAEIYVMSADGTGQTRLTTNAVLDSWPAWSPDGSKILFQSDRDGNLEIYVMNADGTSQTRLTTNTSTEQFPAWSPDGSKIAFQSHRDGTPEIYVTNADGTNPVNLTNDSVSNFVPAWSLDGSKIAFMSYRGDVNYYEIHVINADGSNPMRLTTNSPHDYHPAWR